MKMILLSFLFFFSSFARAVEVVSQKIQWEAWSDSIFERAKKEKKFLLLDLEAVWCHWCHVMEEKTYSNPKVISLIGQHYIALKVDQDSRPDLSNRYEDYGWPATVFYSPEGREIVIRSGFIEPENMAKILQAVVEDPTPEAGSILKDPAQAATIGVLSPAMKSSFEKSLNHRLDTKLGSWDIDHKFISWTLNNYLLDLGQKGDAKAKKTAEITLTQAQKILDPAWGGFYQYSVGSHWTEPHFEKIMSVQTDAIFSYAYAYQIAHDEKMLKVAKSVENYLNGFLLGSNGAYLTSQDADLKQGEHSSKYFALDDAGRRKLGMPRIDDHQYSRENGWVIESLVQMYDATGDPVYWDKAVKAASWILKNRNLGSGGFSHDAKDSAGPYLGDSLAMGRALLALYASSGDRSYLKQATDTALYIDAHFKGTPAGYVTNAFIKGAVFASRPQGDENVQLARFVNLLFHYTGEKRLKEMADHCMRYLGTAEMAQRFFLAPGILLANAEIASDPIHIVVVAPKSDAQGKALFQAALSFPSTYKRTEWYDPKEGPIPNSDVTFPEMKKVAAFACGNHRCSLPAFEPGQIAERVNRLTSAK